MEQKITQQEIAARLAGRTGGTKADAEAFVRLFFDTIRDGLMQDKLVKVKGLGTFKLIEVSDRESVNVNTGERIRIEGHTKVSFTPDNALRDRVNRPFAGFETTIINDATPQQDMESMDIPETVSRPLQPKDDVKKDESQAKEVIINEKTESLQSSSPVMEQPKATVQQTGGGKLWRWVIALLLLAVIAVAAYYFLSSSTKDNTPEEQPVEQEQVEVPQPKVTEPTPEELAKNYPQVEGGDYWIVGEVCVHEMQVGEGLLKIARKELGNSDLMEYIVVFNDIKNPDIIPPGAQIHIPRMVRKK